MKQTLLLVIFIFLSGAAFSQTSFSSGLKFMPVKEKVDIRIYPNPVTTELGITDNKVVKSITVYNTVGRIVKAFEYEIGERFYVGDLPRGIYLVQFLNADKKVITTKRMKKE